MKPSTCRVLSALRDAGKRGLTTHELCQPEVGGIRFGARLLELKEAGFVIDGRRLREGAWHYTLAYDPELGGTHAYEDVTAPSSAGRDAPELEVAASSKLPLPKRGTVKIQGEGTILYELSRIPFPGGEEVYDYRPGKPRHYFRLEIARKPEPAAEAA